MSNRNPCSCLFSIQSLVTNKPASPKKKLQKISVTYKFKEKQIKSDIQFPEQNILESLKQQSRGVRGKVRAQRMSLKRAPNIAKKIVYQEISGNPQSEYEILQQIKKLENQGNCLPKQEVELVFVPVEQKIEALKRRKIQVYFQLAAIEKQLDKFQGSKITPSQNRNSEMTDFRLSMRRFSHMQKM